MRRDPAAERLLSRFPPDGEVLIDGERLSTPYVVSDGAMLLIPGTIEHDAARAALAGLSLRPQLDDTGRALAALWVGDFRAANLGPHQELQVSLLTEARPGHSVPAGPWAAYDALTVGADVVCHSQWNDLPRVVAYQDQHLHLPVRRAHSTLELDGDRWLFSVTDEVGLPIADGAVSGLARTSTSAAVGVAATLGARRMWWLGRAPHLRTRVVSARPVQGGGRMVADAYVRSHGAVHHQFGPGDRVAVHDLAYTGWGFSPQAATALRGVQLAYLRPTVRI